jgi:hypothetical protein
MSDFLKDLKRAFVRDTGLMARKLKADATTHASHFDTCPGHRPD